MKRISVIIPTYQPDYYIWECLDSIYKQSLNQELYEVIIILNGNKEPYYTDILNYIVQNKMKNFQVMYTEIKGVSHARNIGIDKAEGDFIVFLDDDDMLDFCCLELLINNFNQDKKNDNMIVAVESENFHGKFVNKNKEGKFIPRVADYKILKKRSYFSVVWGLLIPKKVIDGIRFNTRYKNGEDSLFMVQISKNIEVIRLIEGVTLHHRRVRNNSACFRKMAIKYIFVNNGRIFGEHLKLLFKKGYNKRFVFLRMLGIIKGAYVQLKNR